MFDGNTNTAVGLDETAGDFLFQISPNPASDNLIIQNQTASTDVFDVQLTNVTGQVIGNYKFTNTTMNIPLNALQSGNYFVRLYNAKMSAVKQFTKM